MWPMLSIPSCIFCHSDSTVVKGQCLVSSVCWQGEQEHVLSAVMTGFTDARLPGFLLWNSTFQAAAHCLWCLLPKNWSTNVAVWMKVLICWWDVKISGICRWWSVLYKGTIPGFFCKDRGKPKMSGIPVAIWAEFCLPIWNQWLSPWY